MSQTAPSGATFLDPNDKFWSLYIDDAEKHDKIRLERWKGDTDGILIFTGLFAATVATFVVASLPDLSSDPNDQTVALLSQMLALMANQTGQGSRVDVALSTFEPSTSSVWINSLWVASLSVSLFCALAATLVQQWCRVYSQGTQRRGRPSVRGPVYARLADGVERFRMEDAISFIVTLLHIAVALFFAGLLIMLSATNRAVTIVLAALMVTGTLVYGFTSIIPIWTSWTPYRTPLSLVIKYALLGFVSVCLGIVTLLTCSSDPQTSRYGDIAYDAVEPSTSTLKPRQDLRGTVISLHRWLRSRAVMVPPEGCTPSQRMVGQYHAIKQVCKSIDEVHEVERTCESLIPILNVASQDSSPRQRFALARLLITELNIFEVLAKLTESYRKGEMTPTPTQSVEMSGRRIILIISFTCSLMRCTLPPGILSGEVSVDELHVAESALYKIDTSRLLTHIYVIRSKLLASQQMRYEGVHLTLDCFLATLRSDMLAVVAAHERVNAAQEGIEKRLLYDLVDDTSTDSWLPDGFDHYTDTLATFHLARRLLFDNCLWILNGIIDLSSEHDGMHLLDSLQHFWVPRVEHIRKVTMLYLPQSHIRQRRTLRDNLESLATKLGRDDLTTDTDWANIRSEQLNPHIVQLFGKYPRFKDSMIELCAELQRQVSWEPAAQPETLSSRAQSSGSQFGGQYW